MERMFDSFDFIDPDRLTHMLLSLDVEEPTSERKIYLEIKQTCKAFYRHE
jgi:hypothetical protein